MKATHEAQAALLTVVEQDNRAKVVDASKKALPEHAQLNELNTQRRALADDATSAATRASDAELALKRVEDDLGVARARLARDHQRIDDGVVSDAKSISSLQDEIAHLDGRIESLEDQQLELMVAIDEHHQAADQAKTARTDIETRMRALIASRDQAIAAADAELADIAARRAAVTSGLPPELMALYEKAAIRGAGGAAELKAGRCTGCGLLLDALARRAAEEAPKDEVVRCEECGRILVRQ